MKEKNVLEGYVLNRLLGKGQYSEVWLGEKDGNRFAVKYLAKEIGVSFNVDLKKLVLKEVSVMPNLAHPNILKLHEHNTDGLLMTSTGEKKPVFYLVYDYCEQGDLFNMVATTGKFSDKLARYYFHQILSALEHVHSKGFVHLDIKLENVLLNDDLNALLADFNLSDRKEGKFGTGKLTGLVGTPGYMAPEILQGRSYSGEKVDIFAMGVLLFTMVAAHSPFVKATCTDLLFNLFCKNNAAYWKGLEAKKPAGIFSPDFKSLINSMLSYKAAERPTIETIKKHPWYAGPLASLEDLSNELKARKETLIRINSASP